ncbi:MAG: hypothetical protein N2654_02710 [Deltaproteobacteria bacterium]|nr:hypothetical protein [Deltaproteobacteria bacterium]
MLFLVCYYLIKHVSIGDLARCVIDGVSLDAGIFLNQARILKDLAFIKPSWLTAPTGYPQQYTFIMTDNFIFPALFYSVLSNLGFSEALSVNLTKGFFNALSGYLAFLFLRKHTPFAFFFALIYQNCYFLLDCSDHFQLQMTFVFPLILLAYELINPRIRFFLWGMSLALAYFSSAYYFVFSAILVSILALVKVKETCDLKNVALFFLPLLIVIPFIIPQVLVALERKRNFFELHIYSFNPAYYFPFFEKPNYAYSGFLGYGFTIMLVLSLTKFLGLFKASFLMLLFSISCVSSLVMSLVSFVLPLFSVFAKQNKAVLFYVLLLFSLSFGLGSDYPTLLNLTIEIVPVLQSIRLPVRYFVAGALVLFLLACRYQKNGQWWMPVFLSIVSLVEGLGLRPVCEKIPSTVTHHEKVQRFFVYAWPDLFKETRPDYLNYVKFSQYHLSRLYSPKVETFLSNSGYNFYKLDAVLRYTNVFPSIQSLRVIKSLGFDHVYSTKNRRSRYLKVVARNQNYILYELRAVPYRDKGLFFVPAYSRTFSLVWRALRPCRVNIHYEGLNFFSDLSAKLKEDVFVIPPLARFKSNPIEVSFKGTDCSAIYVHKVLAK